MKTLTFASCLVLTFVMTACASQTVPPENDSAPVIPAAEDTSASELEKLDTAALEKRAQDGDVRAQVALGIRYATDKGNEAYPGKAFELFKAAAETGDAAGQFLLGAAYARGAGVTKDDAQAVLWYEKSAKQNYPMALYWMGVMISKGRGGIAANWAGAAPYLARAADLGHANAMLLLGQMYAQGDGVTQNFESAARLYRRVIAKTRSQVAQYKLLSMIKRGEVKWQPGDPGEPPTEAGAAQLSGATPAKQ